MRFHLDHDYLETKYFCQIVFVHLKLSSDNVSTFIVLESINSQVPMMYNLYFIFLSYFWIKIVWITNVICHGPYCFKNFAGKNHFI